MSSVADPGFPVGGGGADLRRGCFSAKTNVKTKELDPVEGDTRRRRPPGSANGHKYIVTKRRSTYNSNLLGCYISWISFSLFIDVVSSYQELHIRP